MTETAFRWNDAGSSHGTRGVWVFTVSLLVGTGLLLVAAITAHTTPATGYELSPYTATPTLFWIGTGGAIGIALFLAIFAADGFHRAAVLVLGGLSFLLITGLPLVRGYAFYGRGDAMSHLGWIRDIEGGRMGLTDLLYPGLHALTLQTTALTGWEPERAMMLVVLAFVLLFAVSLTLAARTVTGDPRATVVAAFSSFMLLPLNHISAHMTGHPSTMAIFYLPVVLTLLVVYLRTDGHGLRPTTVGGLLALASGTMVLLHPQQAANLLAVFVTVVVAQRLIRDATTRSLVAQTAFLGVVLVAWVAGRPRVSGAVDGLVTLLLTGGGASALAQRGTSLTAIGSSLVEVFLKLFLVSSIFLAVGGIVMLASLWRRHRNPILTYLSLGSVAVGGIFVVYFAAQVQTMYFRHFGFVMVLVSLFGAIGITGWTRGHLDLFATGNWVNRGTSTDGGVSVGSSSRFELPLSGAAVAIAVMTVLSLMVLYPSPYIFQPNQQVSQAELAGYDSVFAHENPDIDTFGIRTGPDRFRDALTGTGTLDSSGFRDRTGVPADAFETGLPTYFGRPVYLVVSDADRVREVDIYRELRYSEAQLTDIGSSPGVDRVQSNGATELYLIAP